MTPIQENKGAADKAQLLRDAAAAAWVSKKAGALKKQATEALKDHMVEGDRSYATYDGERIGTISVTTGEPRWEVADPSALLRWARTHKPEAVQETLAPWFTTHANLEGVIQETGGEIPPGVELTTPSPRVTVRVSEKQGDIIQDLIAGGQIKAIGS